MHGKHWTESEIKILTDNLGKMKHADIAILLGKTKQAVDNFILRHKVKVNMPYVKPEVRTKIYLRELSLDERMVARKMAAYIAYGLNCGSAPIKAIEGAMAVMRDRKGIWKLREGEKEKNVRTSGRF